MTTTIIRPLLFQHPCYFCSLIGERVYHAPISKIDITVVPICLNIQYIIQSEIENLTFVFND